MAGAFGAEKTDCDSPFSLADATLKWVQDNVKDRIDFVVWTGDSARHDSDEEHPRTDKGVLETNRALADKMLETFSSPDGKLDIPIVPNFGNNDFLPHNIMYPGPNRWFAAYADIWKRFIPEEQRHSFQFGGWFHVDVIPGKLTVFSLNTMYFFDRNAAVDGCAAPSEPGYQHMEWLRVQLGLVRKMGAKAILIGHVPPARTDSKQNWDETCWQRYTLWLERYRDVVVASLYGHMNIDHFLLSDTKQIDLESDTVDANVHGASLDEKEVSVQGKEGYLQELREAWADLPSSAFHALDEDDGEEPAHPEKRKKKKKSDKFRKIGGKFAERYQLSLISPSVVPNYFPTLRVFEYNMTGLGDSAVWEDKSRLRAKKPDEILNDAEQISLELRSVELRSVDAEKKRKKKHKKKHGKGRKKKPKDPNLIIPEEPPKKSLPGPAYYPQPFTLLGYTQYFANLTHINNDHPAIVDDDDDDDDDVEATKWRNGNHGGKKPKHSPAQPREFKYEVEYSTFDNKRFKLKDLTVRSYLRLAYRLGQRGTADGRPHDASDFEESEESNDVDSVKKRRRRKGKKRKRELNKTWLQWLSYAFVQTIPKDELEKW